MKLSFALHSYTKIVMIFLACISYSSSKHLYADTLASIQPALNFDSISQDYDAFYSRDRLSRLGIAFASISVIANTDMDENLQSSYQESVRSASTDDLARFSKLFGEGKIFLPLSLIMASVNSWDADSVIGKWGVNVARAYAVGAPAMLLMQKVTGGSRPGEESYNSKWNFLADNNGVSGHAFMGSIPFLTIAQMNADNEMIKYTAYAASIFTGWSRLNDNQHYLSQIMLGWYMGWETVNSVFETNKKPQHYSLRPMLYGDTYGLSLRLQW